MRPARSWKSLLALALLLPLACVSITACGSGISLDEPIEGPTWRLVLLGDQVVSPEGDPQRQPSLQFDGISGRASGFGGCNRMSATYTRAGSQLQLRQLSATKMACGEPERNALEGRYFQALQRVTGYRLQGPSRLALLDTGGRTIATFEAGR